MCWNDRAILYPGEQRILLGLVPAVHLVDEENRSQALLSVALLGLLRDPTHVGDAGQDRIELLEGALRGVGDHAGQGRFAGAGRAVEDE